MKKTILLDEGDIFSIPLPDGQHAFGQYLGVFEFPLIRIFKFRSYIVPDVGDVNGELLFPPIFVGINPPVRLGRWKRIGNVPLVDFQVPQFRHTNRHEKGINKDWAIWNPKDGYKNVGLLPLEYRSLEIMGVHPYDVVEDRIATGRNWYADGID